MTGKRRDHDIVDLDVVVPLLMRDNIGYNLGEIYSLGILILFYIELMLLFPISIANMR